MARHANPRIYIGPKTNEVIIALGRAYQIGLNCPSSDVALKLSRRKCGNQKVSDWVSYAVDTKGNAHFEIPADFINTADDFPKGFYDVMVFVNDCHIADVELVKAPGHYVAKARSISDKCSGGTEWVEPSCVEPETDCPCSCKGEVETECDCIYKVKNNCPTCFNEEFVATVDLIAGYTDWVEQTPPPVTQSSELDEVQPCSDSSCAGTATVTDVQELNIVEEYLDGNS